MRVIAIVFASLCLAEAAYAQDTYTHPYVKRDGTPVQGHYNTQPNQYRYDNYSSRGNVNPYTGQAGSQRNEFTIPPAYNTGRHNSNNSGYSNPYSTPSERPRRTREF